MIAQTDFTEEVTIIDNDNPQQVIKKTTKQTEPQAKGEPPQKVYDKKKTIFRSSQIIWYILGFIEVLLAFRIILKILGANQYIGFTNLIYTITAPLMLPFSGILGESQMGNSIIEWSTIVAAIVYLSVAWGFIYFLEMIYPITPKDVETN